jgi:hypothetical protein
MYDGKAKNIYRILAGNLFKRKFLRHGVAMNFPE